MILANFSLFEIGREKNSLPQKLSIKMPGIPKIPS